MEYFLLSLLFVRPTTMLPPRCEILVFLLQTQFNYEKNAILLRIRLKTEADGVKGGKWIRTTREGLLVNNEESNESNSSSPLEVHLVGEAVTTFDTIDSIYSSFPTSILITSFLVFFLISFAFKSVIVPLRSLLTISMTLGFVYGAANLVFQRGCLEFMRFPGLRSDTNEIHWIAPVS